MSFLGEIKRRKVFQVAGVYLVVAWLIVQVIDVVNEPLNLPDQFDTVVIVLLAVGFPIAAILAWAFDVTPQGVVRDRGGYVGEPARRGGRRIEYVSITLLFAIVAALVYREFSSGGSGVASGDDQLPNSVAVLPFENLSLDPADAFFASGIHEQILGQLQKINDMTVIARASVMPYAGGQTPIPEIARTLRVETVMTGTLQYADGRFLLTTELVDPVNGTRLWADDFPGELVDVFQIQADIATQVARSLEAELTPGELESIERQRTNSPEAVSAYWRAFAVYGGRTGIDVSAEEMAEFHRHLDEAIAIDSQYVDAYAAKARDYAYAMIRDQRTDDPMSVSDLERLARQHADDALMIEEDLGAAWAALAVTNRFNRRWREAEAAYEQALELSPNDAGVLFDYALFHRTLGRETEAIELADRLIDVNPALGYWIKSFILADHSRFEEALAAAQTGMERYPMSGSLHTTRATARIHLGDTQGASEDLRAAESLGHLIGPARVAEALALHSHAGNVDEVRRLFGELENYSQEFQVTPGLWATAYLATGELDQALSYMREAADDLIPGNDYLQLIALANNFYHDPVLRRGEFVEARDRLGFTD